MVAGQSKSLVTWLRSIPRMQRPAGGNDDRFPTLAAQLASGSTQAVGASPLIALSESDVLVPEASASTPTPRVIARIIGADGVVQKTQGLSPAALGDLATWLATLGCEDVLVLSEEPIPAASLLDRLRRGLASDSVCATVSVDERAPAEIRAASEELTWDATAAGYLELYRRALERPPRAVSRELLLQAAAQPRLTSGEAHVLELYRRRSGFRSGVDLAVRARNATRSVPRTFRRLLRSRDV